MPPEEGRAKSNVGSSQWFLVTSLGTGVTLAKHCEGNWELRIHRSACQAKRGKVENVGGSWFDSESVLRVLGAGGETFLRSSGHSSLRPSRW